MKTATQNEQLIRDAISRSISHNEIVHVSIECDKLEGVIHDLVTSTTMGEWDYSTENDGSLEVYADDWRINVSKEN